LTTLGPNEVYLDSRTGDFFEAKAGKWQIGGNVGIHWVNALGVISDQVKKT
jgi:hypothetical protein